MSVSHLAGQLAKECRCEICRFTAQVMRVRTKLSRYDRTIIDKLYDKWAQEGTDAVYWRLKAQGKWGEP